MHTSVDKSINGTYYTDASVYLVTWQNVADAAGTELVEHKKLILSFSADQAVIDMSEVQGLTSWHKPTAKLYAPSIIVSPSAVIHT